MKIAILKVILWPKNGSQGPRIVPFEPGKINVVTGGSLPANQRLVGSSTIVSAATNAQFQLD